MRVAATRTNAIAGLSADVAVAMGLLWAGGSFAAAYPVRALALVALGLLAFSLIEYAFHRWLFHGAPSQFETGHRQHHVDPLGFASLPFFVPPLFLAVLAAIFALVVPGTVACLLTGAIGSGYAAYGLSHFTIHHARFRGRRARRWAARHHIHHHHPECNFGVTSALWDVILGSHFVPQRTRAHQRGSAAINHFGGDA